MKTFLSLIFFFYCLGNPSIGQSVVIPDANFKAALLVDTTINTNNDTLIQLTEAIAYTGSISVANRGITSLIGIEAFINLTSLDCSNNALNNLDVSTNTALTDLSCNVCQLSSLDVSNQTNLITLGCYNNQLTSLDLSTNVLLEEFYAYNNQLTNLDMSNQTVIRRFFVQSNQLGSLNFKNGNYMNVTHFNVTSNPNLACIDVDDVAYSTTNWDHIDGGVVYSTSCFTSVNTLNDQIELKVYPNPISEFCTIDLPYTTTNLELVVYNNLGQKCVVRKCENVTQVEVNLKDMDTGLYWIVLKAENYFLQQQVVKK